MYCGCAGFDYQGSRVFGLKFRPTGRRFRVWGLRLQFDVERDWFDKGCVETALVHGGMQG